MSKYYGTLSSDKGDSTRAGHRYMRATAQSWEGSVGVRLSENENGEMEVDITASSGSVAYPHHMVLACKLSDLLACSELKLAPRNREKLGI